MAGLAPGWHQIFDRTRNGDAGDGAHRGVVPDDRGLAEDLAGR